VPVVPAHGRIRCLGKEFRADSKAQLGAVETSQEQTEGRVCLEFFSFCSLGIFFMACKAVPVSDRVSKPHIHPNLLSCLASSSHNQDTTDADSLNVVGSEYRGHGDPWFNSFLSLTSSKPTCLTSQENVATPLCRGKPGVGERKGSLIPFCLNCASTAIKAIYLVKAKGSLQ